MPTRLQVPLRSRFVDDTSDSQSRLRLKAPGEFLGEGSYGQVYMHEEELSGERRVVKTVIKPRNWTREDWIHEAEVMRDLDHPHVLRLLRWYEHQDSALCMVMDFCAGGELLDAVRDARRDAPLSESWVAAVFRQLFEAIAYCHGRGVVHKDLKTDNILLLTVPPPDVPLFEWPPHAVVADWGLAEHVSAGLLFSKRGHEVAGTEYTMAPEVWKGNCGQKCDVWSLGVVFFQVFSNKIPFDPPDAALATLPRKARGSIWLDLHKKGPKWELMDTSKEAQGLCKQMLRFKEKDRPQAEKCREHPWIVKQSGWCQASNAEVRAMCASVCTWHQRHPLQQAMLLLMASSFSNTGKLASIFSILDRDHNGVLSKEELQYGLQQAKVDPLVVRKAVASLDFNSDGACSYMEFLASCLPCLGDEYETMLRNEFRILNEFGHQSLTVPQIGACTGRLMTLANFTVDLPDLDQNGDEKVSYDEFVAFFGPTAIPYSGTVRPGPAPKAAAAPTRKAKDKKLPASPKQRPPRKEPMAIIVNTHHARQLVEPKAESSSSGSDWSYCSGSECGSDEEEESRCGSCDSTSPSLPGARRGSQGGASPALGVFPAEEETARTGVARAKPGPRGVGCTATSHTEVARVEKEAAVAGAAHARPSPRSVSSTATPRGEAPGSQEARPRQAASAVSEGPAGGGGRCGATLRCEDGLAEHCRGVGVDCEVPRALAAARAIASAGAARGAVHGRRTLALGEDLAPDRPAGVGGPRDETGGQRLFADDQAPERSRVGKARPVVVSL